MLKATRATKAYERAVNALDGPRKGAGGDMTASLARSNEQLAKGMNLLRGGAVGAGVGLLLNQMKSFSAYAKEMGDSATDAQKSAAKWGGELEKLTGTVKGWGASALGTLAQWGRDIGDSFRDPVDKAYDEVAESSEEAANRQEAALEKTKAAMKKAADEIPALLEKLQGEKRETELQKLGEYGRVLTERYELEKKIAELARGPQNAVTQAEGIRAQTELEKVKRRETAITTKILKEEKDQAAKDDEKKKRDEADRAERVNDELLAFFDPLEEAAKKQHELVMKQKQAQLDAEKKLKEAELDRLNQTDPRRNEGGRFTTRDGKVIVSDEDRARSDATSARNAGFDDQSRRNRIRDAGTGRGASAGQNPVLVSNQFLKEIAASLKPTEAPKT
jgi:hypothetical protein